VARPACRERPLVQKTPCRGPAARPSRRRPTRARARPRRGRAVDTGGVHGRARRDLQRCRWRRAQRPAREHPQGSAGPRQPAAEPAGLTSGNRPAATGGPEGQRPPGVRANARGPPDAGTGDQVLARQRPTTPPARRATARRGGPTSTGAYPPGRATRQTASRGSRRSPRGRNLPPATGRSDWPRRCGSSAPAAWKLAQPAPVHSGRDSGEAAVRRVRPGPPRRGTGSSPGESIRQSSTVSRAPGPAGDEHRGGTGSSGSTRMRSGRTSRTGRAAGQQGGDGGIAGAGQPVMAASVPSGPPDGQPDLVRAPRGRRGNPAAEWNSRASPSRSNFGRPGGVRGSPGGPPSSCPPAGRVARDGMPWTSHHAATSAGTVPPPVHARLNPAESAAPPGRRRLPPGSATGARPGRTRGAPFSSSRPSRHATVRRAKGTSRARGPVASFQVARIW
jgi:hypothetical protein